MTWLPYRARAWAAVRLCERRTPPSGLFAGAPLDFAPGCRMRLSPTDVAHRQIALTGAYELSLTRQLVRLARRGGLFVDVGANYGYFSLIWAAAVDGNLAIAFEAATRNAAALQENIVRNGLEDRVAVRACAAGRIPGTARFDAGPPDQTGWGGLTADDAPGAVVPVVTLDEELAARDEIAALKIDVEGADAWVIEGASRLLEQGRIRHVFFEENLARMRALGIAPGEAGRVLLHHGYRLRCIGGEPGLLEFHAQRP